MVPFGLFRRRVVVLTPKKSTPRKKTKQAGKDAGEKRNRPAGSRQLRSSPRAKPTPGTTVTKRTRAVKSRRPRTTSRTVKVRAAKPARPEPVKVGRVTHYFRKVKAGVIKVTRGPIDLGDTLYFKGHTTDFKQKVSSMQIEGKPIKRARRGQLIGLEVRSRVREGDEVYLVRTKVESRE